MPNFAGLHELNWPAEFVVEYTDGRKERLVRGSGVVIDEPGEGVEDAGGLNAGVPMGKSHLPKKNCGKFVSFTVLRSIMTVNGVRLWPAA